MQIIEHVTIIVPFFSNPKNNSPQAVLSLHFRLPHSITYTREVLGPVKSVKILGTLYDFWPSSQCWFTIFCELTANIGRKRRSAKRKKKQHSVDVSQLFLSDQTVRRLTNFNLNLI